MESTNPVLLIVSMVVLFVSGSAQTPAQGSISPDLSSPPLAKPISVQERAMIVMTLRQYAATNRDTAQLPRMDDRQRAEYNARAVAFQIAAEVVATSNHLPATIDQVIQKTEESILNAAKKLKNRKAGQP